MRYAFFIIFSLLMVVTTGAIAQNRVNFSSTEDVAIAFYKTGGVVPNFERWIKATEPYNLTPWARREGMMQKEKLRLHQAYQNFNPARDYLFIRTSVTLDPQMQENEGAEPTYSLPITFTKAPDALYFPYDFLGERIVVMPGKLDKLMNGPIEKHQYNFISGASSPKTMHTMIVQLKPTEADMSMPYRIDGLDQWVLKAEIVSLEVWDRKGKLLWEYTAPWYTSPNKSKINKLYEGRPQDSLERGAVKALNPKLSPIVPADKK